MSGICSCHSTPAEIMERFLLAMAEKDAEIRALEAKVRELSK